MLPLANHYWLKRCVLMTVYFIGAGPGAADLLTLRADALIRRCEVCSGRTGAAPRGAEY